MDENQIIDGQIGLDGAPVYIASQTTDENGVYTQRIYKLPPFSHGVRVLQLAEVLRLSGHELPPVADPLRELAEIPEIATALEMLPERLKPEEIKAAIDFLLQPKHRSFLHGRDDLTDTVLAAAEHLKTAAELAKENKKLPSAERPKRPRARTYATDKLHKEIFAAKKITQQMQELPITKGKAPCAVKYRVILPEPYERLTPFQQLVYEAILSILGAGNVLFTIPMIYHFLTQTNEDTPDAWYNDIAAAIEVLRHTNVDIQPNTNERSRYNDVAHDYNGYMVPCTIETRILNGVLTVVYIVGGQRPPFFAYAADKHQIQVLPLEYFKKKGYITVDRALIAAYIDRRIIDTLHSRSHASRKIKYASLYAEVYPGEELTYDRKRRIRETVEAILEDYKHTGIVTSWHREQDTTQPDGVHFTPGKITPETTGKPPEKLPGI